MNKQTVDILYVSDKLVISHGYLVEYNQYFLQFSYSTATSK